jgi:hypothetical protein
MWYNKRNEQINAQRQGGFNVNANVNVQTGKRPNEQQRQINAANGTTAK